jgi:methionine aminopeptidase
MNGLLNNRFFIFLVGIGAGSFLARHSREILRAAVKTSVVAGQRIREVQEAVAEDIEDDLAEARAKSKSGSKSG